MVGALGVRRYVIVGVVVVVFLVGGSVVLCKVQNFLLVESLVVFLWKTL